MYELSKYNFRDVTTDTIYISIYVLFAIQISALTNTSKRPSRIECIEYIILPFTKLHHIQDRIYLKMYFKSNCMTVILLNVGQFRALYYIQVKRHMRINLISRILIQIIMKVVCQSNVNFSFCRCFCRCDWIQLNNSRDKHIGTFSPQQR